MVSRKSARCRLDLGNLRLHTICGFMRSFLVPTGRSGEVAVNVFSKLQSRAEQLTQNVTLQALRDSILDCLSSGSNVTNSSTSPGFAHSMTLESESLAVAASRSVDGSSC